MISKLILPLALKRDRGQVREQLLRRFNVDLTDLMVFFFEHYHQVREHAPIELVDRLHLPPQFYVGLSFSEAAEFEYLLAQSFGRLYARWDQLLSPILAENIYPAFQRFVGTDVVIKLSIVANHDQT